MPKYADEMSDRELSAEIDRVDMIIALGIKQRGIKRYRKQLSEEFASRSDKSVTDEELMKELAEFGESESA